MSPAECLGDVHRSPSRTYSNWSCLYSKPQNAVDLPGGWEDFVGSFDTPEDAVEAAPPGDEDDGWWHVVDSDRAAIHVTSETLAHGALGLDGAKIPPT